MATRAALAALLCATAFGASAQQMPARVAPLTNAAPAAFRAPLAPAAEARALVDASAKAGTARDDTGRLVAGSVRAVAKDAQPVSWLAVDGGFVARIAVSSGGATGLRAHLLLPAGFAGEIAARGAPGDVEAFASQGNDAWTAWTPGDRQDIEVFSRERLASAPVVESIVHFALDPTAKLAGTCSPDVACTAGDAALDAAIAERRNSVVLLNFVDGALAITCTATLINTDKAPAGYLVTANHCLSTTAAAASVTTTWFDDTTTCGGTTVNPAKRQVAGGATLVYTSYGADSTLLLMKTSPPAGATYAAWNAARLADGDAVVSISHPQGDVKKFALGKETAELQVRDYPQDMYGVTFTRGVTEGGSSGSGLFTLAGGSLQLRGVLSGSTLRTGVELSCANADVEDALYGRFEIFYPQIADYITLTTPRVDDHGNRITEATRVALTAAANPSEVTVAGRIDYPGDVDVFRVDVPAAGGTLTVRTVSAIDTIGTLLDANGKAIKSVNDAQTSSADFGLTRRLAAGTYYVAIAHRDAQGTGAYSFKASLSTVTDNYTDLWWNASESGWGININHQGNILFAALFNYDTDGSPLWLVMAPGTRQTDGSWSGTLYRGTGPVFNASPWTGITNTPVGTMRITFTSTTAATLSYSVNGRAVNKAIVRQVFAAPPTCTWSAFDRSYTTNFQDLWWNPDESGWGINITHQGAVVFATLFTFRADGQPLWLSSAGTRIADGLYIGSLDQSSGPPFSASPWNPAAVTHSNVGTMTVQFTRGNMGSLTYTYNGQLVVKSIQREVFASPATECFAAGDE